MRIAILLLLILGTVPFTEFAKNEFNLGLDAMSHVARLASFSQSLKEGIMVPRWAGGPINSGYGHPVFIFNYSLPFYLGSFFHTLSASYEYSIKLVFVSTFALSGIAMFFFVKDIFGVRAATIAALMYLFAPYRFTDIFDRAAIGESVSFLFIPLVCVGLGRFAQTYQYRYILLTTLSFAGLILSHYVTAVLALPIFLIYAVYQTRRASSRYVVGTAVCFLIGLGIAAHLLLPAILEGKYTHRSYFVNLHSYQSHFVSVRELVSPQTLFIRPSYNLGPLHIFLAIAALRIVLFRPKSRLRSFVLLLLGYAVLTLFFATPFSRILWERIELLRIFQFPFRFLSIAVFISSVLASVVVSVRSRAIPLIVGTLVVLTSVPLWHPSDYWATQGQGYARGDEYFEREYRYTTDDGYSSPIWALQFMDEKPTAPVAVIAGTAGITHVQRNQMRHQFVVDAKKESRLRDNTLYFPGWTVLIDGVRVPIEFQDINHRGIITFWVHKGVHLVDVIFMETRLRQFANMTSLFSVGILVAPLALWKRF